MAHIKSGLAVLYPLPTGYSFTYLGTVYFFMRRLNTQRFSTQTLRIGLFQIRAHLRMSTLVHYACVLAEREIPDISQRLRQRKVGAVAEGVSCGLVMARHLAPCIDLTSLQYGRNIHQRTACTYSRLFKSYE